MIRRLMVLILGLILMLASSSICSATPHSHDSGFFMRLSAGIGQAETANDVMAANFKMSGLSGDINLAFGFIVVENLALHASLHGWTISDPDVKFGGLEGEAIGDLTLNSLGGGFTYYIMPSNLYISASLGIGTLDFNNAETDNGLAGDLTLGKEWWKSDRWGIGLAGCLGYHSVPDGDAPDDWTGLSFGIRFTATLN
ncbi:MAG: hypothetical protein GY835_16680 [bacterium]|nr:hypothetical protein [bacterium]